MIGFMVPGSVLSWYYYDTHNLSSLIFFYLIILSYTCRTYHSGLQMTSQVVPGQVELIYQGPVGLAQTQPD